MNHRKLIPANGISTAAIFILPLAASSHCEPGCAPSGSDERIRIRLAPNNNANATPAAAAARGVVRLFSVDERFSGTSSW